MLWGIDVGRMRVPRGFKEIRRGSARAIARDDIPFPLDLLNAAHELDQTEYAGRRSIGAVQHVLLDGSRLLVRHATRGGLLGRIIPDIFCGRCRPFRELAVAQKARERGIPTAEVVASVRWSVFGPFYRGTVYTKEIHGSLDLLSYLSAANGSSDAQALRRKRDALRHVGRMVRSAHDAGLYHADLQVKNILVRHGELIEAFLIDLDKARWYQHMPDALRIMNLLRLSRSAAKAARSGTCISRTDILRFLTGYIGPDGPKRMQLYWRAPLLKPLFRAKWSLSDIVRRLTAPHGIGHTR